MPALAVAPLARTPIEGFTDGSGTLWTIWNDTSTTSCTYPWNIWTSTATDVAITTTNTLTTSNSTWTVWTAEARSNRQQLDVTYEAWQERDREMRARVEAHALARRLAEDRAEALLKQCLSLEQQLQFARDRSFVVQGSNGYRYRIRHGRSGNVDMVRRDGTIERRLCAHPAEDVPDCDTMLAQKIMLEVDEASFLRTANRHPIRNPHEIVLPRVMH